MPFKALAFRAGPTTAVRRSWSVAPGGRHIVVDASLSSQFLTGLLMALPLCGKNSRVSVSQLKSTPMYA